MSVEGDKMMEEAREKRKRGESEDDDVVKRAKSSSSGQVSAEGTMKILRKLEREERKRKRDDGAQDVDDVKVAGYAVNEDAEGWSGGEVDGDELEPEQVKIGRKEELEFMVKKLDMSEFGTYEEAVSRGGKQPTTTKWIEEWEADDKGGRFVKCRLVGQDFKVKGVEEREDLFAAMPPLESKKLMFRMEGPEREVQRRRLGGVA